MENKNQKGNSNEFKADEIDKRFEMNTSFASLAETDLPQDNPSPLEPPPNDAVSHHSPVREIAGDKPHFNKSEVEW